MRYQYKSQGFKNDFYGSKNFFKINLVNALIIINIIIFFIFGQNFFIINDFSINPNNFYIWQPLTYMFFHGDLWHLAFNMFLLWMFGKQMELIWGAKKFLIYYLLTGAGSGVLIYMLSDADFTIGASGAIMAVLFAYGYTFPNRIVLFWFIPMKVKYCILLLISIELLQEFSNNPDDRISHIGHLGGMFIGFMYLKFGSYLLSTLSNLFKIKIIKKSKSSNIQKKKTENVDKILDKLKIEGWEGLTEKEKGKLFQASKEKQKNQHIN
tara:strand:- start:45 stop:845 length:801 start_codon:yes stop_codon:yes gene_type:complete